MSVYINIMPYTIINVLTDVVSLTIGQTSVTYNIDCSRITHDVSRIELQSAVHQFPTNNGVIYHATSTIVDNMAFVSGIVLSNRSGGDTSIVYVRAPRQFRGIERVDMTFTSPIATAGNSQGVYTIMCFSDADGRYI